MELTGIQTFPMVEKGAAWEVRKSEVRARR